MFTKELFLTALVALTANAAQIRQMATPPTGALAEPTCLGQVNAQTEVDAHTELAEVDCEHCPCSDCTGVACDGHFCYRNTGCI